MNARATSFATLRDLRAFIGCLRKGNTFRDCLQVGDNGTGAWGDNTATLRVPLVALPAAELIDRWGSSAAGRGKMVRVEVENCIPFHATVGDIAPAGIIDLNPAALVAAGLPSDCELDRPAKWEWV